MILHASVYFDAAANATGGRHEHLSLPTNISYQSTTSRFLLRACHAIAARRPHPDDGRTADGGGVVAALIFSHSFSPLFLAAGRLPPIFGPRRQLQLGIFAFRRRRRHVVIIRSGHAPSDYANAWTRLKHARPIFDLDKMQNMVECFPAYYSDTLTTDICTQKAASH